MFSYQNTPGELNELGSGENGEQGLKDYRRKGNNANREIPLHT